MCNNNKLITFWMKEYQENIKKDWRNVDLGIKANHLPSKVGNLITLYNFMLVLSLTFKDNNFKQ